MSDNMRQSPSGRFVRCSYGQLTYTAFIPHDLPPSVDLDWDLAGIFSEADRAIGELAGLGRVIPNPQLLIRPFVRREAVLSSRIEGTQTDIARLYAYEAGQLRLPGLGEPVSEADTREVENYVQALEYGLEAIKEQPITLNLLRELHHLLLTGVRGDQTTVGDFRSTQNWIGRGTLDKARYVPPPPIEMRYALDNLDRYIRSSREHPPLIRIGFIHYQFEAIHPFDDGNGRIGRLLISLLLVYWGILPSSLLYLSAYFERHRDEYIDLLFGVSQYGAWKEWLTFFLRGVTELSHDASSKAKQLQDLQRSWHERLSQARTSALPIRLADSLFALPIVTVTEAAKLLEVTYPTAQRIVEKLAEANIIMRLDGSEHPRVYVARDILTIVSEGELGAEALL